MISLWNPQGAENWGYATTPQPGLGGRSIDVARGKVLGGSSAVNAMIYVRGNRRDFESWAQLSSEVALNVAVVAEAQRSRAPLQKLLNEVTGRAYWEGAVRMLIAREPEVLT